MTTPAPVISLSPADLIEAREELGMLIDGKPMSQERFADFLGVSAMTVSRWERGVHTPSQLSMQAIRTALVDARQANNTTAAHLGAAAVRKIDRAADARRKARRGKAQTAQASTA